MRDLLSRRDLLRGASLAALGSFLPSAIWGATVGPRTVRSDRCLVLIELSGGNDGLNTIIPLDAVNLPLYRQRRPTLQLREATSTTAFDYQTDFFRLGSTFTGSTTGLVDQGAAADLGIHAAMVTLMDAWRAKDLAIVHGTGYRNPNDSHFRSIDIWHTAATDEQPLIGSGWLGRMLVEEGIDAGSTTNAILFGRAVNSPVGDSGIRAVAMNEPQDFIDISAYLAGDASEGFPALVTGAPAATGNATLDRILTARWQAFAARAGLVTAMRATSGGGPHVGGLSHFGDDPKGLMKQARDVFRCIAGGLPCPVYKLALDGFDTHTDQKAKHADLLAELANAIAALRSALIGAGKWDSTLVMTYSEFGRRTDENGSAGTDHGGAAPHLFVGGGINGGIFGTQPTLVSANYWDSLVANLDFRRLGATCGTWLGVASASSGRGVDPFDAGLTFAPIEGLL